MPVFDLNARSSSDKEWALLQTSYVHIYWRDPVLEETVNWLRSHDFQILAGELTSRSFRFA